MTRTAGKSMASGGILSLARLLTGVVRVKVVALALGASGVGAYSVLVQLYLTCVALTSMSLAIPIINLGRRHVVAAEFTEAGDIAGTALGIVAINWIILALAAAFFGRILFVSLGVSPVANGLAMPIVIAVLFGAMSGSFWEGMSYLCDRFDIYVRVGILAAVADMAFVALGAWFFGLRGAVFAMPAGPFVMFAGYWLSLRRDLNAAAVLRTLKLSVARLRGVLPYSALMLATGALANLAFTYLRSRTLIDAGAAANGYLQVATSLSAYLLSFVMTGFWGHLHAPAAAAGDTREIRAELDRALTLGSLIAFTGCGATAVLADYLVPLLYSGEFRPGVLILTAYLPGELCFQLLSMLTAYQITVLLRRRYLVWSLAYIALLVIIGLIAIPRWGPMGYVTAHVGTSVAVLLVLGFFSWRIGQIQTRLVLRVAGLALVLTAVCAALFAARAEGYRGPLLLVALVPFAASGVIALRRLLPAFWPVKVPA